MTLGIVIYLMGSMLAVGMTLVLIEVEKGFSLFDKVSVLLVAVAASWILVGYAVGGFFLNSGGPAQK